MHSHSGGLVALAGGLDQITSDILLFDDELDAILSAYTAYCLIKDEVAEMDKKMEQFILYKKCPYN